VSLEGGYYPQWAADGRELFFVNSIAPTQMLVVDVRTAPSLLLSRPRVLFEQRFVAGDGQGQTWAVSRDGQRFLLLRGVSATAYSRELRVVQNWFEDVRRLAAPTPGRASP
jgi:hypothetical protein